MAVSFQQLGTNKSVVEIIKTLPIVLVECELVLKKGTFINPANLSLMQWFRWVWSSVGPTIREVCHGTGRTSQECSGYRHLSQWVSS